MRSVLREQENKISILDAGQKIDRALSALETAHNVWLRQSDKYQRQRALLELGWLTEEILPPDELENIMESGRRAGFYVPLAHWFYEHIQLNPCGKTGGDLFFALTYHLLTRLPICDAVCGLGQYQAMALM